MSPSSAGCGVDVLEGRARVRADGGIMKPAKCVICGLPTERRLTRNLGVCRKCEPPEPWKEEAQ